MASDYISHVRSAAVADLEVVSVEYFVEQEKKTETDQETSSGSTHRTVGTFEQTSSNRSFA